MYVVCMYTSFYTVHTLQLFLELWNHLGKFMQPGIISV